MIKDDKLNGIKPIEDHNYYLFNQDFTYDSTGNAIKFILERNLTDKPPKYMKMIINSPGGDLYSAFALIDTIRGSKIPIYMYGLGIVASAGLMTFMSGSKGHRYLTKNTAILSHQFFSATIGKEHELMSSVKEFKYTSERVLNHYKKCTGLDEKSIKKFLLPPEDTWLSPEEALKLGIADKIIDFS
jgi:ATP-dependent Clp protease protease subunit